MGACSFLPAAQSASEHRRAKREQQIADRRPRAVAARIAPPVAAISDEQHGATTHAATGQGSCVGAVGHAVTSGSQNTWLVYLMLA
eukprot:3092450-Alexandrium_andersonii.AAC.1